MQEATQSSFDMLVMHARAAALRSLALTEHIEIKANFMDGSWREPISRSRVTGTASLVEHPVVQELLLSMPQSARDDVGFKHKLVPGDRFPQFTNLTKFGYEATTVLEHIPGEVLLVLFGTIRPNVVEVLSKLQSIIAADEHVSEGVKMVAVCLVPEVQDEWPLYEAAEKHHWTSYNFMWALIDEGNPQQRLLDLGNCFQVVLVGRSGLVEAIIKNEDELRSDMLMKKLNRLLQSLPLQEQQEPKNVECTSGESSWKKVQQLFATLLQFGIQDETLKITILAQCHRVYCSHEIEWRVQPLSITSFVEDSTKETTCRNFVDQIVSSIAFDRRDYSLNLVSSSLVNEELQLKFSRQKVEQLLFRHRLTGDISVSQTYQLNVVKGTEWERLDCELQPNALYDGPETMARGKEYLEQLKSYRLFVRGDGCLLTSKLPFRTSEAAFCGIGGLKDYTTGESRRIQNKQGIVQIVLLIDQARTENSSKAINYFIKAVSKNVQRAELNLIYTGKSRLGLLTNIVGSRYPGVHLYIADQPLHPDVQFASIPEVLALVVDPQGTLVRVSTMRSVQEVEVFIHNPCAYFRGISEEFKTRLSSLPTQAVFKQVQSALQLLTYKAEAYLVYESESARQSSPQSIVFRAPTLRMRLRPLDSAIVAPLLKYFEGAGHLSINSLTFTQLPLGKDCYDCGVKLEIPYYYFFVSRLHKCVQCAELEFPTSVEMLLRYPTMENSVLMFEKTEIPDYYLGFNLQPQEELECKPQEFRCIGCTLYRRTWRGPRYICLGCLPKSIVSFCESCAKHIRGEEEAAKLQAIANALDEEPNHLPSHALLRILYNTPGSSRY